MPTSFNQKASKPVYVTGVGMTTPAGAGVSSLWELARGKGSYLSGGVGQVENRSNARAEEMALQSAFEALRQSGNLPLTEKDGLILSTTTGNALLWEKELMQLLSGEGSQDHFASAYEKLPLGSLLESLALRLEFTGRRQVVSTACAAGVHAVALGASWIQSGLVDRCLVGGVEVLCQLVLEGFRSLQLLSPERCRPFDAKRAGINLAEGAAFLVLESASKSPLARISGWGMSLDAHHMTAPEPEGRGTLLAMRRALEGANLSPGEIDWVHAHGTGSAHNDLAESKAIGALFAGTKVPPVSSTKGTHGHLLGATGVVELALIVESLQRQEALPTTGFESPDAAISIPILHSAQKGPLRHVLKTILGFGGSNGAMVVSRV